MTLQALAKYRDQAAVAAAVERGLAVLLLAGAGRRLYFMGFQ